MAAVAFSVCHPHRADEPSPPRKDVSRRAISRIIRIARARAPRALASTRLRSTRAPRPRDLPSRSFSDKRKKRLFRLFTHTR
jgi:hypothetical protein